jgi:esterase/lipase superfamily enzyme
MKVENYKWYSESLGQDMELRVYGDKGIPFVIFPAMGGRFFEFEDFGMIKSCSEYIEKGKIQLFTVDCVDNQSWLKSDAMPNERAARHEQYDQYICKEIIPFVKKHAEVGTRPIAAGCSVGGYHAANFFFKHPDLFAGVICLSGVLSLKIFVGDYIDESVYYNSPLYYLPNLSDEYYLKFIREGKIFICVGQGAWEEPMIADAREIQKILLKKKIPAWIDFWGFDVNHDWVWWRKQFPYLLDHFFSLSS